MAEFLLCYKGDGSTQQKLPFLLVRISSPLGGEAAVSGLVNPARIAVLHFGRLSAKWRHGKERGN
jgi:hypothetical protein